MALLTAEEKAKLAQEGIWVTEKCDCCKKPILAPPTYWKKGQSLCATCAKGQNQVLAKIKEENEMEKKAKEKKAGEKTETKKIAGHLVEGTAIADLYQYLEDEKKHPLKDAVKLLSKHKANPMGRIYQLGVYGKKFGGWGILVDQEANTIQMKLGKQAAIAAKSVKTAKSAKPEKKSEVVKEAIPSKALKATATLVRRVLKTGKNWTKNKLIETMKKEHDQDPKRVEAAIKEELQNGGLTVEDGVLQLA